MQAQPPMDTGLEQHGVRRPGRIHWNLTVPELYEQVVRRREGQIAQGGALVVRTGPHTGRSPQDRFLVRDSTTEGEIAWGPINQPMPSETFDALHRQFLRYLDGKELFVQDLYVCAHPEYRMPIRVITELAWHSLFAQNLFLRRQTLGPSPTEPEFTVLCAPNFAAVPARDGTRSGTVIAIHLSKGIILIGGSHYAGEIKKSVFTALNFLLPQQQVCPMHCSANEGPQGEVALFFGLSGTGKTTLSTDSERRLIGDDEHGWCSTGIFNFEGGCYAKVIGIRREDEPEIYQASVQFGTVLENVALDAQTRQFDFSSTAVTENTRAAYPIPYLPRIVPSGLGDHPQTIFLLTYDAFGVLPPIARLTVDQAIYYYLLGYTAKVAGTERGVRDPEAPVSPCFGAPFLPRPPLYYARLLQERLEQHQANVWLLNTGITGGPYGTGSRMPLPQTRALVRAALNGSLLEVPFTPDPIFGLHVPTRCPGMQSELLQPRRCWSDPKAYDETAQELAERFDEAMRPFDLESL
jgi:phosphoenolpyruvate carboxykinase (ATP)